MKPRKNYRTRLKKTGAKKNQRIAAQKRRLIAVGYTEDKLKKMNVVEIRDALKKAAKKKVTKAKPVEKKRPHLKKPAVKSGKKA